MDYGFAMYSKTRYDDLLREAENERLIKVATQSEPNRLPSLRSRLAKILIAAQTKRKSQHKPSVGGPLFGQK